MAIRCKLISPTNLMLERPMLSPVDEVEYVVHGVKEIQKIHLKVLQRGLAIGFLAAVCLFTLFLLVVKQ